MSEQTNVGRLAQIEKVMTMLRELWLAHPEQRLGQLIENYVIPSGKFRGPQTCWIYYAMDDNTEAILEAKLREDD